MRSKSQNKEINLKANPGKIRNFFFCSAQGTLLFASTKKWNIDKCYCYIIS